MSSRHTTVVELFNRISKQMHSSQLLPMKFVEILAKEPSMTTVAFERQDNRTWLSLVFEEGVVFPENQASFIFDLCANTYL